MIRVFALSVILLSRLSFAGLSEQIAGDWELKSRSCNKTKQKLANSYVLSFEGKTGSVVSKNKDCLQVELETLEYPSSNTVSVKSGMRECTPNPCAADFAAKECGKEGATTVTYTVKLANDGKTMTLTTNDTKECAAPAVLTFQQENH